MAMQFKSVILPYIRATGCSLIELLVFFPVLLLIQTFLLSTGLWTVIVQAVALYLLGFAGGSSERLSRRIYELLYVLFISGALSCIFQGWNWHGWAGWILGIFVVMRGIRYTKVLWGHSFPIAAYIAGLIIYFVFVPFMKRIDTLSPYYALMNGLGFLALAVSLFTMNRYQLAAATLSDPTKSHSALSRTVRGLNRIWVTFTLLAIGGIGFFFQIKDALLGLARGLFALLSRLTPEQQQQVPAPVASSAPPGFPPMEKGEPSWIALLLEKIMIALAYVLVAALIIWVLYLIVTRLLPLVIRAIRKLLDQMGSLKKNAEAGGYVDEKEVLFEWRELPGLWRRGLAKRFSRKSSSAIKWSQLASNKDRIRFIYRAVIGQAMEDGYLYNKSHTPLETALELAKIQHSAASHPTIASAYNQARYGELDPADDEVNQVLEAVKPFIGKQLK
jgi:hypothetical protein